GPPSATSSESATHGSSASSSATGTGGASTTSMGAGGAGAGGAGAGGQGAGGGGGLPSTCTPTPEGAPWDRLLDVIDGPLDAMGSYTSAIAVDACGNAFIGGGFQGPIDLGGGAVPGTTDVNSVHAFLAAYDRAG